MDMSAFYFWTEQGQKYGSFDLYGFLNDEFFDTYTNNRIALDLREIPPHELYGEFEYFAPRGCGKKRTAQIVNIVEKYRMFNNKHFCDCGEPYLRWYKFCPVCGKERKA